MGESHLLQDDLMESVAVYCRCLIDCPGGLDNSTCLLKPNAKCYKKKYINEQGVEEVRAGCLGSLTEQLDQCNKLANPDFSVPTDLKCCNNGSLCNDFLEVSLPSTVSYNNNGTLANSSQHYAVIIGCVLGGCLLVFISAFIFHAMLKKREHRRKKQIEKENRNATFPLIYDDDGRPASGPLDGMSSLTATSSGAGMPLLVQRTISRQIETVKEIGRGRYGTVKLGRWRGENVALKIFFSKDEDSWFRETEIYQTVMLRHENILGFIAADISGACSYTQLYLITEYHEKGSLYDYLHNHALDVNQAVKMAYTACCGLAHLHTEITGTKGKPGIAHRDVKSKNILVKRDGQCCIADMGLAVQYSRTSGKVDIGSYEKSRRQGTHRYMAPEVLMQSFHPDSFVAYKASDVYSFSLVLWEIINRTRVKGVVDCYHPPYYDVVGNDPDVDEMKKVVVTANLRPEVTAPWTDHPVLRTYVSAMQECWVARHESRLTMLRVRKTLNTLFEKDHKRADESTASSESDRKMSRSSSMASTATANSPDASNDNASLPQQSTFAV